MNIQRRFPPSVAVCRCLSRLMMMKVMMMMMTVLWVLFLYGVSAGKKKVKGPGCFNPAAVPLPALDMAPNSVDDMYDRCIVQMEKEKATYLKNEMNKGLFEGSWEEARKWYKKKNNPNNLSNNQRWALYVYSGIKDIYEHFNKATREGGLTYKTDFKFHALHFYLTTAVQELKKKQNGECYDVYRRTDTYYSDNNVLNKKIRFGAFASSSKNQELQNYGDKGCFEINTCMGADISEYSRFQQEEVLIPPYEVFKVVKITKRSDQPDLWCDVVYELKSERNHSKYNCALFKK